MNIEKDLLSVILKLSDVLPPESYLVGGCIRDSLLGRRRGDADIAVKGDGIKSAFLSAREIGGKAFVLDKERGIARLSLSEDMYIDFTSFDGKIEEDLSRRDFTINSIALRLKDLKEGRIDLIDPFHGREDIEKRIIRAVSEDVFREDPLRLLRAVRLKGELGFEIEDKTLNLIKRDSGLIKNVAGERIREELLRILKLENSFPLIKLMDEVSILLSLIPELGEGKGVSQPPEHFWDVYEHSLRTVEAIELILSPRAEKEFQKYIYKFDGFYEYFTPERIALLKIACLLHDVAKPRTRKVEGGRIRFIGHPALGADMAEEIMRRMRFSNKEIRAVRKMIENHLRPSQLSNLEEPPTRRAIYRLFRDTEDVGIDTLYLSLADHLSTRGPALEISGWELHNKRTEYMLKVKFEGEKAPPPKLIDGYEIMEKFSLKPGPIIGRLLEAVREAQAAGEISTKEEALSLIRKELERIWEEEKSSSSPSQ